jgi:hypothetical protein
MGKAYSSDLRERVMAAVDCGTGAYAVASIFQVSVSYVDKALGRRRQTGETGARPWVARSRSSPRMTMPFAPMFGASPTRRSPSCRLGCWRRTA